MTAFFRRPQNWPILFIPLLLLVWARFIAPPLGEASFENVALFKSPYLAPLPVGTGGQPVTEHVVIVVIDGLRLDTSRQLPTLNSLRAQGADRAALVGQPSFSLPGWTVIGTGAWQEQSGISTNFFADSIPVNTIFENAKAAGLTTAIVGSQGWGQLYSDGVDTSHLMTEAPDEYTNLEGDLKFDQDLTDLALGVLQDQPNLMLIHLLSSDSAAHGWGGISPQYAQATQNADAQIARILAAIDLSNTAVFVTADHGHLDQGGHGGWEPVVLTVPLVSAGQGIRPGQYADAQQADIAVTVATLLGTALPSANQGRILFDQLDMPDEVKAARAADLAEQITTRYNTMIEVIDSVRQVDPQPLDAAQEAMSAGNADETVTQTQAVLDSAYSQWTAAKADRLGRERLARLPVAVVALAILVAYLWWWRREHWGWRAPLVGTILYFVLWNANYFLIDRYTYSISMFNIESLIRDFITGRVIEALVVLLIVTVVVALLRRRASRSEVARDVVHTMLLIAAALGVQMLIFYILWDFTPSWYLPDLLLGFKYYLDLYQSTAFWPLLPAPAALLLPLIGIGVAWLANRLAPGKRQNA